MDTLCVIASKAKQSSLEKEIATAYSLAMT
jgi:hypothetical protein